MIGCRSRSGMLMRRSQLPTASATLYVLDETMQQIGTAVIHLVTISDSELIQVGPIAGSNRLIKPRPQAPKPAVKGLLT